MRYLLLVCSDGTATAEQGAVMRDSVPAWVAETEAVRLGGHALAAPDAAATVRVRGGETIVTDGPFADTKEHVGGFDVIDCADLDEAIEVAAKHPVSWFHMLEVRPFAPAWPPADPPQPWTDPIVLDRPVPPGHERYAMLFCADGIPGTDAEEQAIDRDARAWLQARRESGAMLFGNPLRPPETATTVRVRDGETIVSDGPFIETKEFIGGIDVVDCASREEAIGLAATHPLARFHMIEVRPFAADPRGDADTI